MSLRVTVSSLIVLASAASQSSAPASQSSLTPLLDQVAAQAAAYRAALPSLSAEESITSTANGIFKHEARARAIFRVIRKSPDGPLTESRQIVELDGKPIAADRQPHLPLTFQGAFGDGLEIFFAPAMRLCFDFALGSDSGKEHGQRIDFAMHSGREAIPACAHTPPGVSGFAVVDPETRQIRHLERTVPEEVAVPLKVASFASIDYADTPVGDRSLWLPGKIVARLGQGKAQFIATYSNYHRFAGTITLLPSITP